MARPDAARGDAAKRGLTVAILLALAAPAAAGDPGGEAAAGRRLFDARCRMCHTPDALAGKADRVEGDLHRIDDRMSVVGLLWTGEVADLKAFLTALPRPGAASPRP